MHPPKKVDPSRANRGTRRPTAHRKTATPQPACAEIGHIEDQSTWVNHCPPMPEDRRCLDCGEYDVSFLRNSGVKDLRGYRPSPPALPKCERCEMDGIYHQLGCPTIHGATEPTECVWTENAFGHWQKACSRFPGIPQDWESELRGGCPSCGKLVLAVEFVAPTAPPAESVEDVKALEDRARDFADRYWESSFGQSDPLTTSETHDLMAAFAEAEIERQTPAIERTAVEKAFAEVEKVRGERLCACPEFCECGWYAAMQTVKARRSGGEEK